jgi:fibronectin type 3 domain-containing protein
MVDTPTNFQIIETSNEDELTLDWDEVNNADSYYLYRSQSSGSSADDYTQIANPSAPPYTDAALEDGEKYYYRVSSFSQDTDSMSFISQPSSGASVFEGELFGDSSGSCGSELEAKLQLDGSGTGNETFTYEVYESTQNPDTDTPIQSITSNTTTSDGSAYPSGCFDTTNSGYSTGNSYFFYVKYVDNGTVVASQKGNTWDLTTF